MGGVGLVAHQSTRTTTGSATIAATVPPTRSTRTIHAARPGKASMTTNHPTAATTILGTFTNTPARRSRTEGSG